MTATLPGLVGKIKDLQVGKVVVEKTYIGKVEGYELAQMVSNRLTCFNQTQTGVDSSRDVVNDSGALRSFLSLFIKPGILKPAQ